MRLVPAVNGAVSAARTSDEIQLARLFGVDAEPAIDTKRVQPMCTRWSSIALHDSAARFEQLGIKVMAVRRGS